uniref:Dynamin N-terminal domain-containing protein n=1 Tax=Kalanchoe fedtschenkoi TaxID=63787 RepID=A0A7N0U5X8_KALFE
MDAIDELAQLSDSMRQASALLADEDVDENTPSRRPSTFLNLVTLGNVGAGKSAVLNSLIGHPVLPTGENGATRAPITIDLQRDDSLSSKSIVLQIDNKSQQVSAKPKVLAAVQALLLGQGPPKTAEIPWVALIGQSVSIASAQSGSENSLETAWKAESESLKSILTSAPQSKLGRVALVDTLAQQIRNRMKIRLPNLLSGLQGKSQIVQDELARFGEQMVHSSEGTRAVALELCREFEDKFLQHIAGGEGAGWKVVASFEGNFPNRIKQLPLDNRVLVDIVSAAANATPGLGRYPPFKREVVTLASSALEIFKTEAKKMVVALVDMERAFVPPQHFIRLVQRRMERQRREDELKNRSSKKGSDAEQSLLNRVRDFYLLHIFTKDENGRQRVLKQVLNKLEEVQSR